jgi:hypothetical protein
MNWRRGLFRLWIVGAALFVIAVAVVSYSGIKAEFDAVASKPEGALSILAGFRQRWPQYNDWSDAQLADALYKKFYSDMPREQFDKKIAAQPGMSDDLLSDAELMAKSKGLAPNLPPGYVLDLDKPPVTDRVQPADPWAEFRVKNKRLLSDAEVGIDSPNPWASVGRVAGIAFGIPLVVLILGASLVWAFSGFSATRSRNAP